MRAWRLDDAGRKPGIVSVDVPQPAPGPGEVLIRVEAAGVTPTELGWYPTTHLKTGGERKQAVPGHEFSGSVAAVGPDVTGVAVGDEIYGMNDWFIDGATAEYCLARPEGIAPRPRAITAAQAAALPIAALTAWQGLIDRAKLQPGERVLIHGGSGAVGVIAIQLARHLGARVLTTASARHREFLTTLGAETVIDYHTEPFEARAAGVDVVFDGVGGEILKRSWAVLGPNGRLVTIASNAEGAADERTKKAFFIVSRSESSLCRSRRLWMPGKFNP